MRAKPPILRRRASFPAHGPDRGALRHVWLIAVLGPFLAAASAEDVPIIVHSILLSLDAEHRDAALQERLAVSPLSWPAANLSLTEAVVLLAATGNQTSLLAGTAGDRRSDLPALTGNYWQGVMAVCSAFDLIIQQGSTIEGDTGNGYVVLGGGLALQGAPIAGCGGPVVLAPRLPGQPRPIYLPCAGVLAEMTTLDVRRSNGGDDPSTLDALVSLRLEPHVHRGQVGAMNLTWSGAQDDTGKSLDMVTDNEARRYQDNGLHLTALPKHLSKIRMVGDLQIAMTEPVELLVTLHPGQHGHAEILSQSVSVDLLDDNVGAPPPLSARGPGIALLFPTTLLGQRPQVRMTSNGQLVPNNLQGSTGDNGRLGLFYGTNRLADTPYDISLSGHAALGVKHVPLRLDLDLGQLPTTSATLPPGLDLQTPSHVSWPAASMRLGDAVQLLRGAAAAAGAAIGSGSDGASTASGDKPAAPAQPSATNDVLLELGVDERRVADLPAFSGNFWDAALLLCRVYDLTILPPSVSRVGEADADENNEREPGPGCITGGPLVFGSRSGHPVQTCQACGILLMGMDSLVRITDQSLRGIKREAKISFHLRLEPRFDVNLISSAVVSWATHAGQRDGQSLAVVPSVKMDAETDAVVNRRVIMRMIQMQAGRRRMFMPLRQVAGDGDNQGNSPDSILVTGLPEGPSDISLTGQVALTLHRVVSASLTLTPGGNGVVQLSGQVLPVQLFTSGTERNGLRIEMTERVESLVMELRDPTGKVIRAIDGASSSDGRHQSLIWYFPPLDQSRYTITVSGKNPLATLCLPFALAATAP